MKLSLVWQNVLLRRSAVPASKQSAGKAAIRSNIVEGAKLDMYKNRSGSLNTTEVMTSTFDANMASPADDGPGLEAINGPSEPTARLGLCTYLDLTMCESTTLVSTVSALSLSVAVASTENFVLGRYIRFNPGGLNQEDARVVGFGKKLTEAERKQLNLAAEVDAAENAKEVQMYPNLPATY